jgi:hypothetical protein
MGGVGRAASLCTSSERHAADPPAEEKGTLNSLGKVISGATPQELVKISMDVCESVLHDHSVHVREAGFISFASMLRTPPGAHRLLTILDKTQEM